MDTPMVDMDDQDKSVRHVSLSPNFLDFHITTGRNSRHNTRLILIDWLADVAFLFKLNDASYFMAVQILDLYLSKVNVHNDNLQILGSACLLIASKFHEVDCPEVIDFIKIADNLFERKEFLNVELEVLKRLEFDIWFPTLYWVYNEQDYNLPRYQDWLVKQTLEVCLYNVNMYKFKTSNLVEAVLYLFTKWEPTFNLAALKRSISNDFKEEIEFLFIVLKRHQTCSLKAIKNKYASTRLNPDRFVFPKFE